MQMFEARVSINRIGEYLRGPEKAKYTDTADCIIFEHTSMAWPVASMQHEREFMQPNVSIRCPP